MNITVVGAGVIGCAVAHELASRGARVQLVDPRGPGRGATGASAGILAPLIEGHSQALRRLGTCSLALWDDFIRRIQIESDQTIEYERSGTLQIALNDQQSANLTDLSRSLQSAGVPHSVLDGRAARQMEPGVTDRATMGLLVPAHGYVGAASLIHALMAAAARQGVSMVTTRAMSIDDVAAPMLTTETCKLVRPRRLRCVTLALVAASMPGRSSTSGASGR